MMTRLQDRGTSDWLVLLVAGTICLVVVGTSGALIYAALFHPEADSSPAAAQIGDIINTLVGLLAGFLAGKAEAAVRPPTSLEIPRRLDERDENPQEQTERD